MLNNLSLINLRINQKKLARLILYYSVILFVQSCQSPRFSHNESARQNHAKELLKYEYKTTLAVTFEGDHKFTRYISEYINAENEKLNSDQMAQAIVAASAKNHYDPVFLLAVIKTESQFNPKAVGSAGELGLMQAHYINAYNMGINNLQRLPASSQISHPYYSKVMQNYIGIYQELQKIKKTTKS